MGDGSSVGSAKEVDAQNGDKTDVLSPKGIALIAVGAAVGILGAAIFGDRKQRDSMSAKTLGCS